MNAASEADLPLEAEEAVENRPPTPIVPARSVAGRALTLVVGIMSFLACLTVGAVSLVADAAREWRGDLAREMTAQVRPVDGVNLEESLRRVVALAEETPGVGAARIVSAEEGAALLEPWLGSGFDASELPIPRLIIISLAEPQAVDTSALARRIQEVPGASLDDHRAWSAQLSAMAGGTVVIGVAVLALVLVATVFTVVFATRGAMAGNRDVVDVLHLVGAEDRYIAGEFQRHFLVLGLKGGIAGGIAAIVVFVVGRLLVGHSAATDAQINALLGTLTVGPSGYFGVLGVVFLIALLTAVTSRITVHRFLAGLE